MDEEVTAAEAARLTGLSERTIRRRIASHDIPARQIARNRYAIRVQDLPIRPLTNELGELKERLTAVEVRLSVLELQQRRLEAIGTVSSPASSEGQPDVGRFIPEIDELLAEVSSRVHRLTAGQHTDPPHVEQRRVPLDNGPVRRKRREPSPDE